MEKFTFNMNEKRFLKVIETENNNIDNNININMIGNFNKNKKYYQFKNSISRNINLDKCLFKVSVMDLLLMKDILEIMGY